jgi:hypothetical protein
MHTMERLTDGWHIPDWRDYIVLAIMLQLSVRVLISALGAVELRHIDPKERSFWIHFWRCWKGVHPNDDGLYSDYWFASILGLIELLSYPVLMKVGAWSVIGAWLGFKTVAQWRRWTENRVSFNRYLIGNAVCVLLSLLLLVKYVAVDS